MRGNDEQQDGVFSYVSLEQRVPASHPLRAIRKMVNEALGQLSGRFEQLYAATGRPSIAPEKLLRALLLQALYGKRSERLLMEELDYSLLFRWFVGLAMDDEVWDATVFSKNRDRLIAGEIASQFFQAVQGQLANSGLLSDEHFTVDGTMLEAWASRRSFHAKAEPPARGSGQGGKRLLRDTHESGSDPEARLYRKCNAGAAKPQLSGTCADGKPAWSDRGGLCERSGNASGARGRLAVVGRGARPTGADAGSGQTIPGAGVCEGATRARDRAPHCGVRTRSAAAAQQPAGGGTQQCGVCAQSKEAEVSGTKLCLDQTLGRIPPGETAHSAKGGVVVPNRSGGVQLGAMESAAGGCSVTRSDWQRCVAMKYGTKKAQIAPKQIGWRALRNRNHRVFQQPVQPTQKWK